MRNLSRLIALILLVSAPAHAEPAKIAVFDFELVDTSLQGEVNGPRADEQRRLREAGDQLRKALADSGKFIVLDIAPVLVTAMSADFRGNTDESWTRTTSYLLRNRLLAPNYGAPQ